MRVMMIMVKDNGKTKVASQIDYTKQTSLPLLNDPSLVQEMN